ncbi:hypothetical protein [Nocardioides flavescens]|uniref:Uncharacterized protein n=1 Tax=Nocardioides flavescens TaxID=2691959 RepID=A0A6L7F0U2_9ACTN|nr:hypothetical protein [Nocardioides flavescens]MXG89772.1 hypothetical protein [Nocardioides flavescens]
MRAGLRKEDHVFDSLDLGEAPYLLGHVVERAHGSLEEVAQGRSTGPTFLQQAAMIADEQLCFDYFTGLFSRDPQTRLTLDVTPDYARLSTERFASIRGEFERRGVRAVERIWSQVRMQRRRRPGSNPGSAEQLVAQLVAQRYAERFPDRDLARIWPSARFVL